MPNSHLQMCRVGKLEKRPYIVGKDHQQEVQVGTDKAPLGERFVASLYLNSAVEVGSREDAEHTTWSLEANGDQI